MRALEGTGVPACIIRTVSIPKIHIHHPSSIHPSTVLQSLRCCSYNCTRYSSAMPEPAATADSEPKVQYVLSGQPTGLAAMANAVREYDDERVENCKEDIDTLLVFVSVLADLCIDV